MANDRFAFHVHGPFLRRSRADVATKETVELVTKQAREISVQLKGHVDALVLLRRCFDAIRLGAKAAKTAQTLYTQTRFDESRTGPVFFADTAPAAIKPPPGIGARARGWKTASR